MLLLFLILMVREEPVRPVHTYSIVAYDAETGEMGAAVQSHWFSVGSLVIWAEAGVGAVATQSFVRVDYGPLGLRGMAAGGIPEVVLRSLLEKDDGRAVRQVAMVDARGKVAGHTGSSCIDFACDKQGRGYSVQANLMLKDTVCDAMSRAFENTKGSLARRMMAALSAAEGEGGDIRGKQSAAMLVVKTKKPRNPWEGMVLDLRVEDHPKPIEELERLIGIQEAYDFMNQGDLAVEHGEVEKAMDLYGKAVARLPGRVEPIFWQAVNLVGVDRLNEAKPLFQKVFAVDENWRTLVPRLVRVGLLPKDKAVLDAINAM